MKNKFFITLALLCQFFFVDVSAQIYTQGDLQVVPQVNFMRDSTQCGTLCIADHLVNVQNSYLGDSVLIIDAFGSSLYQVFVNTTGQTLWSFNFMAPIMPFVSDNSLSGNDAFFPGPDLKIICGPDTIPTIITFQFYTVTDPCIYNNFGGQTYFDVNNDCVFNGTDIPLQNVLISSVSNLSSPSVGNISNAAISDGAGNYSMQLQESWLVDYTVSIPPQYQFMFPNTACSPGVYLLTSLPQSGIDFSLQCTGDIDVNVSLGSSGAVRPGVPFVLYPGVANLGCDTAGGQLRLILDANVTYNPGPGMNQPTVVSGDTLIWDYTQLSNLGSVGYWNNFFASVHVQPDVTVNIGDTLCFEVFTGVLANDVNALNNQYSICLPVVNSYDPNDKAVMPQGIGQAGNIPEGTTELTYTVRFQNTGNAPAINVSIVDTMDADILPGSLQILGNSHVMSPEWISPGVVKFKFNNIMLPDSVSDEPNSHGYVRYKVLLDGNLPVGTEISNTAYIYFDFNAAIVTNTTLNTIATPLAIQEGVVAAVNGLYPNPAKDELYLSNNLLSKEITSISIFNVSGAEVMRLNGRPSASSLNVSALERGIYFLQVNTEEGVKNLRFVKD
jgi:uncharacterized repeat protein (TIGR01451 family)